MARRPVSISSCSSPRSFRRRCSRGWRRPRSGGCGAEPAAKFLLAWLVPSWIVFELVVTKLPHYVLPLYPAIAILIAGAVESRVLSRRILLVRGIIWWFLVPGIVSILAVVGAVMIAHGLALLGLAVLCRRHRLRPVRLAALRRRWRRTRLPARRRRRRADGVRRLWRRRAVAEPGRLSGVALAQVLKDAPCQHPLAASAGYEEPSLVFLTGTATRFTDAEGAADFLRQGSCRFAFIDTQTGARLRAARRGDRAALRPRPAHRRLQHHRSASRSLSRSLPRRARRECGAPDAAAAKYGQALLENTLANLARWLRAVATPPPARLLQPHVPAIAGSIATLVIIVISMFAFDVPASAWVAHQEPQWLRDVFEKITDFGLSGWFLFPFGFGLVGLAAIVTPKLSVMSRGVLVGARGALRLSVSRDRPARPVRHHRQAPDRPRAALRRRLRRSVCLPAVHLAAGICEHAVRPFDHGGRGRGRDRRGLAAQRVRSCGSTPSRSWRAAFS